MLTNIVLMGSIFFCASQSLYAMEVDDSDIFLLFDQREKLRSIQDSLPRVRQLTQENLKVNNCYGNHFWQCVRELFPKDEEFTSAKKLLIPIQIGDCSGNPEFNLLEEYANFNQGDVVNSLCAIHLRNDILRRVHLISLSHHEEYQKLQKDVWYEDFLKKHSLLDTKAIALTQSDHAIYDRYMDNEQ